MICLLLGTEHIIFSIHNKGKLKGCSKEELASLKANFCKSVITYVYSFYLFKSISCLSAQIAKLIYNCSCCKWFIVKQNGTSKMAATSRDNAFSWKLEPMSALLFFYECFIIFLLDFLDIIINVETHYPYTWFSKPDGNQHRPYNGQTNIVINLYKTHPTDYRRGRFHGILTNQVLINPIQTWGNKTEIRVVHQTWGNKTEIRVVHPERQGCRIPGIHWRRRPRPWRHAPSAHLLRKWSHARPPSAALSAARGPSHSRRPRAAAKPNNPHHQRSYKASKSRWNG